MNKCTNKIKLTINKIRHINRRACINCKKLQVTRLPRSVGTFTRKERQVWNEVPNQGCLPSRCGGQVPCLQGSNPLMPPLSATQEMLQVSHLVGYCLTTASFFLVTSFMAKVWVWRHNQEHSINRNMEENMLVSGTTSIKQWSRGKTWIWWVGRPGRGWETPFRTAGFCVFCLVESSTEGRRERESSGWAVVANTFIPAPHKGAVIQAYHLSALEADTRRPKFKRVHGTLS